MKEQEKKLNRVYDYFILFLEEVEKECFVFLEKEDDDK